MARKRQISPSFFVDEDLVELPPLTRLLFAGLWTLADRVGRLEERPGRIKLQILPADSCDVPSMLAELAGRNLIRRYEVEGRRLIEVRSFLKHQTPHFREAESILPPPAGLDAAPIRAEPRASLGEPSASPPDPEYGIRNTEDLSPRAIRRATAPRSPYGAFEAMTRHSESFARIEKLHPRPGGTGEAKEQWFEAADRDFGGDEIALERAILAAFEWQIPFWRTQTIDRVKFLRNYLEARRWTEPEPHAPEAIDRNHQVVAAWLSKSKGVS